MTDRLYHHGAKKALQLQSKLSPTYFYYFRYRIKNGETSGITIVRSDEESQKPEEINENFLGISHGDDVFLIYYNPSSREFIEYSEDEKIVSSYLINLYQNFSYDDSAVYDRLKVGKVETNDIKSLEIFTSSNYAMTTKDQNFGHSTFWDALKIQDA